VEGTAGARAQTRTAAGGRNVVRASRNVGYRMKADPPDRVEPAPSAGSLDVRAIAREEIRAARADAAAAAAAASGEGAPAAKLDYHSWARSWGAFLNAISDEDDRLGARREISRIMDSEEYRPRNALGERVGSEGGYLVPQGLTEQVLVYLTSAAIRPRATQVPMDSLWQDLPSLDNPSQSGGAQGLGGLTFAMVAEGAAIPATSPQFGRVQLEARKFAAMMTQVPNELVDDSPAFNDFTARVIGMGFAWALDDLDFNGTGVGEPQGILNAPGALSVTRANSGNAPVHADVVAMLKGLHPASKAKATWLMSEDVFDALLELYEIIGTAPSGQMIAAPQTLVYDALSGCWRLLGLPAIVTDHQPAAGTRGDLALSDLSLYLAGMRQGLVVERSANGRGFVSNASDLRVKARVDGRYWPQSPYTLASGKVTSPLVVLN
jgi:HK97 family phage major capsid protein